MRGNVRISGWANTAMSLEAQKIAAGLRLVVIGTSPRGPWVVRHPNLSKDLRGGDVNALVLTAAKELVDAR